MKLFVHIAVMAMMASTPALAHEFDEMGDAMETVNLDEAVPEGEAASEAPAAAPKKENKKLAKKKSKKTKRSKKKPSEG